MKNNNILYAHITDIIKEAKKAGYNTTIIINGEYYVIVPESVPDIIEENNGNDLPFK